MFSLLRTEANNPAFLELIEMLDEDLNTRYGTLQKEYDRFNSLDSINNVIIAYHKSGPAGCGSFKEFDTTTIEIKRMFVKKEKRGSGVANKILFALEEWGRELGYKISILETGKGQPEAIRFYQKSGYTQIENFGQYAGNANSICMSKKL